VTLTDRREVEAEMGGEQLMRTVVAAFEKSDLQPLLNALHDEVVWKSASRHEGPFSFGGDYRNRAGVVEVLSNISKDYTFRYMKPKEIVAHGEVVWGLFDVDVCYDAKGRSAESRTVQLEIAIHWRLKDGKIIEHQAFFDTAHLLVLQKQTKP
jgi:ketosteroid isomerase-like protein